MPVDFLTDAERERWQSLPDTVPQDDLYVFFLLTDDDKREAQRQREPHNRLGYALQLCILRYLGFVPDDLQETPHEVVTFVAEQLHPRRTFAQNSRLTAGRARTHDGIRLFASWFAH